MVVRLVVLYQRNQSIKPSIKNTLGRNQPEGDDGEAPGFAHKCSSTSKEVVCSVNLAWVGVQN